PARSWHSWAATGPGSPPCCGHSRDPAPAKRAPSTSVGTIRAHSALPRHVNGSALSRKPPVTCCTWTPSRPSANKATSSRPPHRVPVGHCWTASLPESRGTGTPVTCPRDNGSHWSWRCSSPPPHPYFCWTNPRVDWTTTPRNVSPGSCGNALMRAGRWSWQPTTWSSSPAPRIAWWSWPRVRSSPTAPPVRSSCPPRSSPPRWPRCSVLGPGSPSNRCIGHFNGRSRPRERGKVPEASCLGRTGRLPYGGRTGPGQCCRGGHVLLASVRRTRTRGDGAQRGRPTDLRGGDAHTVGGGRRRDDLRRHGPQGSCPLGCARRAQRRSAPLGCGTHGYRDGVFPAGSCRKGVRPRLRVPPRGNLPVRLRPAHRRCRAVATVPDDLFGLDRTRCRSAPGPSHRACGDLDVGRLWDLRGLCVRFPHEHVVLAVHRGCGHPGVVRGGRPGVGQPPAVRGVHPVHLHVELGHRKGDHQHRGDPSRRARRTGRSAPGLTPCSLRPPGLLHGKGCPVSVGGQGR